MTESDGITGFDRIIFPHLNAAYNLARWLLRSDQDAQDVVHDCFLRAHRYFDAFEGTDGRAWLLGIVRNSCMTWLQGTKRLEPLGVDEPMTSESNAMADPERALLLKEDIGSLRDCIEALAPQYREVIVLRELEELSYKEISGVAGLAIGTVMSRLNRARAHLENCLNKKMKRGRA